MLKPCEQWAERLSSYLDGELGAVERERMEAHLANCPACRAMVELYHCDAQDISATLNARGASENFSSTVMQQIIKTDLVQLTGEPITAKMEGGGSCELSVRKSHRPFGLHIFEWGAVAASILIVFAIIFPTFSKAREKSKQTQCTCNQKQIVTAIGIYAQENQNRLPSSDTWVKDIDVSRKVFDCKTEPGEKIDYAYNTALSGMKITSVSSAVDTPLTFDARDGKPAFRHNGGIIMSFADGHIEYLTGGLAKQKGVTPDGLDDLLPSVMPPTRNYGLAEKLQISYRADIALQTRDVQGAMEQAETILRRNNGFVLTSDFHRGTEDSHATVSGRVPSEKLGTLLLQLAKLGTVTARTVNGEDLTAQHIEQWESLRDLAGSQGSLASIGRHAGTVSGALSVESERSKAARDASSLRVDEYKLQSRVTLAEVSVEISSIKQNLPSGNQLGSTATGSMRALFTFGRGLLAVCIVLFIWSPVWGGGLWLTLYLRRRKIIANGTK